jgi:lysophospholipase L1-like esterase
MIRLTARRRFAYAFLAVVLAAITGALAILLADIYLHFRVQNLAGVNVWGYRGAVVGRKSPGEIRVVVLGGSTAFGYGLPANESWSFYLEELLNSSGSGQKYRVVNLGAPGQGAYGFAFDLADYAYLRYDVVILYEGYNDLGNPMAFDPTPAVVNHYLWRRQSPVFRLTGYFPILPLVFREKAMALRSGGQLDAAYRGEVHFSPGLAARMTASALTSAATVAEAVGRRVGRLTDGAALSHAQLDTTSWRSYTDSVVKAVADARTRGARVIVVTQPYISDAHVAQQRALTAAIASRFDDDSGVRHVNLGTAVDLRDSSVAYDGIHLVARANRTIAEHLVQPVREILVRNQSDR